MNAARSGGGKSRNAGPRLRCLPASIKVMSDQADYDKGPGCPVSGAGNGAVALTALDHYLEAERIRHRKSFSEPRLHRQMDADSMQHYVAAIAAAQVERLVWGDGQEREP